MRFVNPFAIFCLFANCPCLIICYYWASLVWRVQSIHSWPLLGYIVLYNLRHVFSHLSIKWVVTWFAIIILLTRNASVYSNLIKQTKFELYHFAALWRQSAFNWNWSMKLNLFTIKGNPQATNTLLDHTSNLLLIQLLQLIVNPTPPFLLPKAPFPFIFYYFLRHGNERIVFNFLSHRRVKNIKAHLHINPHKSCQR